MKSYLEKRNNQNKPKLDNKNKIRYFEVAKIGLKLPFYCNLLIYIIIILIFSIDILTRDVPSSSHNLFYLFLILFIYYFFKFLFSKYIYKNEIKDIKFEENFLFLPKEVINKKYDLNLNLDEIKSVKLNYFPGSKKSGNLIFTNLTIFLESSKLKIQPNSIFSLEFLKELESRGVNCKLLNTKFLNKILLISTLIFIIYIISILIPNFF